MYVPRPFPSRCERVKGLARVTSIYTYLSYIRNVNPLPNACSIASGSSPGDIEVTIAYLIILFLESRELLKCSKMARNLLAPIIRHIALNLANFYSLETVRILMPIIIIKKQQLVFAKLEG